LNKIEQGWHTVQTTHLARGQECLWIIDMWIMCTRRDWSYKLLNNYNICQNPVTQSSLPQLKMADCLRWRKYHRWSAKTV